MIKRSCLFALLAVVACSESEQRSSVVDTFPDSLDVKPCNPLTQSGCSLGEKCTWVVDQLEPLVGHVGCAFDGETSVGSACEVGAQGDDCVEGAVCVSGECKTICDLAGGAPACGATQTCTTHPDIFVSEAAVIAGACEAS